MNITVTKNQVSVNTDYILNDKEYNVNQCYFTFSDEYTDDLVKKAIFVQGTSTIEMSIINNQCQIPAEVLNNGQFELRVYAYEVDGDELLLRYSPSYTTAYVRTGSYIENAESPEVITPTQFEQYMQAMNDGLNEVANVDIDAEQLDNGMSVTITNRYGEDKTVYAYDGEKGETGATPNIQIGTVVTGDHSEVTRTGTNENPIFNFVLEKGEKGDTGNGIASVTKTSTSGLVDTYTITYTNGTTTTFDVINGKSITNVEKTSTSGLEDTYTITYNDNTTSTFTVTNGNGISSIEKTGTQDNVDTYTIYYTNGTTSTFTVTNSTVTNQEFEELKAEHEELVNTLPRVEGTGESITLDNTAQYNMNVALNPSELSQDGTPTPTEPIPIKKVTGNNSITVCGKNLFDYTKHSALTLDANGRITTTKYYMQDSAVIYKLKPNTNYTFVFRNSNMELSNSGLAMSVNGSWVQTNTGKYTLTSDSKGEFTIKLGATSVNSIGSASAYIQLVEGSYSASTVPNYEPYQGQTYPINLGSLEYCKIGNYSDEFALSTGVQLFNKNGTLNDGFINVDGDINSSSNFKHTDYIPIQPNTSYVTSGMTSGTGSEPSRAYYDINKNFISAVRHANQINIIDTSPNNAYYMIESVRISDLDSIMINEGSTALPWEPYGIGNWYLKKNIGKFSDSSQLTSNSIGETSIGMLTPVLNIFSDLSAQALGNRSICNVIVPYNTSENRVAWFNGTTSSKKIRIYCSKSLNISTYQDMKDLLNGMIVYYVLETPTSEEITDTTLITQLTNLYNQIKSYKGQTNITQTNAELPFNIDASALYDLNNLISRVEILEVTS